MDLLKILRNPFSRIILIFILSMISLHTHPSCAETITFASDEWCPYICEKNMHNGLEGYIVDIASNVFQKAGYNTEFRQIPLKRSIDMCRAGKIDSVLAIYREDAPDFVIPKKEQGLSTNIFMIKKDNKWRFKNIQSLDYINKLGVIANYEYPVIKEFIKSHPEKIEEVLSEKPVQLLSKMLLKNRIDAFLEDRFVVQYTQKEMKLTDFFTEAGTSGEANPVYIVFSPLKPNSKKYAEILVNGVEKLRKSGELDKIMNKYGLQDWRK